MKKETIKKQIVEERTFNADSEDAPIMTYTAEADIPEERRALLDGCETFLRIMKFKGKPNAAEMIAAQEDIDLSGLDIAGGEIEFMYLDGTFKETFYRDIFKAIRNSPRMIKFFENLGDLIKIWNEPKFRPILEKMIEGNYKGPGKEEAFFADLTEIFIREMFSKTGAENKTRFKAGGRSFADGPDFSNLSEILEQIGRRGKGQIFGAFSVDASDMEGFVAASKGEDGDPINGDECNCENCRLRRAIELKMSR